MNSIAPTFDKPANESKPHRRWLFAWLFALVFSGCSSAVHVKDTSHTFRTVVIDAGHGGHNLGTTSRWGGAEKSNTLAVALRLDPKLRAAGFQTVLTRKGDYFVELNERAAISNRQDNAIFVSIHFNEGARRAARGTETYYKSRPSRELAERIQRAVSTLPGASSRGVKTANFRVLKRNEYPAVLVECGFLSNPAEGCRCATSSYQEMLAGAIAGAIIEQCGPLTPATAAR